MTLDFVVTHLGDIEPSSEKWRVVIEIVLSKPAHTDVPVSKFELPHPLLSGLGFVKHFGDDAGQIADYRLPLPDGRELHVKEYAEDYETHWDHSSAIRNPPGHLLRDGTKWLFLIITLIVLGAFAGGYWLGSRGRGKTPPEAST